MQETNLAYFNALSQHSSEESEKNVKNLMWWRELTHYCLLHLLEFFAQACRGVNFACHIVLCSARIM